jgi:hypothetical protein
LAKVSAVSADLSDFMLFKFTVLACLHVVFVEILLCAMLLSFIKDETASLAHAEPRATGWQK